jgi:hypothetical protein
MKTCKNGTHQYPKEEKFCRQCKAISSKEWSEKNKERSDAIYKEWYKNNREHSNAKARAYYKNNKEKVRATQKVWQEANKEKVKAKHRDWFMKNMYGLTQEHYNDIYLRQDSSCAICKTEVTPPKKLDIDHSHVTGKVRGLLCGDCNRALGLLKDNPDFCFAAGHYLKLHEQPSQAHHTDSCSALSGDPFPNES